MENQYYVRNSRSTSSLLGNITFIMKASSMAVIVIIACYAICISGQNYIRLSRSDPNFVVARKTHLDQPEIDRKANIPANIGRPILVKKNLPLKAALRQEFLESLVPSRNGYRYSFDNDLGMPYQTIQKRTNYVRLAKKAIENGRFPELYDDLQYGEN